MNQRMLDAASRRNGVKGWEITFYLLSAGPWTFVIIFSIYYLQLQNHFGYLPEGGAEIGINKGMPAVFTFAINATFLSVPTFLIVVLSYFINKIVTKKGEIAWIPVSICFIGNALATVLIFSDFFM